MSQSLSGYVVNKFTGRTLKVDSRAYKTYLKKLRREEEDALLLASLGKEIKKKRVLQEAGLSDDDDETISPVKFCSAKPDEPDERKRKKNIKDAMDVFNATLSDLGDDPEEQHQRIVDMFKQLGIEE